MTQEVKRNYLEITSLNELKEGNKPTEDYSFSLINPVDFQLNKFFYKNIGKKHRWIDRLVWSDSDWIKYVSNSSVETYILKINGDLAGYFELIIHKDSKEIEIAYFGLLEEYHNKGLGSHLLSLAIKKSFLKKPKRVWLHTCSLDHENALRNYISRGMKIFKKESVII